jgi:hypothetical protein
MKKMRGDPKHRDRGGMDYQLYAKIKFGADAEIHGNAPFALASLCDSKPKVFLYVTAQRRHEAFENWARNGCHVCPCMDKHERFTIEDN